MPPQAAPSVSPTTDCPVRSVLFVCTGNICRSPTADGVLRALAPHLTVDSAGTHDYHVGEAPDSRSQQVAKTRGYDLSGLKARAVKISDFHAFDLILAMDAGHYEHLKRMQPKNSPGKLATFCEYAGIGTCDVPDPYYGDAKDFEECFELIERGCVALTKKMSLPRKWE
jgi:protein-tyrosine phosphatase